jgi:ferredoxin
LYLCFSNPQADELLGRDFQHRGHIDLALLRMQLPIKPYHFYICGPSAMMKSLVPALEEWGVPEARIHFEAFGPASIRRNPTPVTESSTQDNVTDIVVNFSQSGKQLSWSHSTGSLLELAEAHGVSVNSGCRSGSCGSCQTSIKSGEVSYRQPPDFDPEPGTCLLCVCSPKISLTLEA